MLTLYHLPPNLVTQPPTICLTDGRVKRTSYVKSKGEWFGFLIEIYQNTYQSIY